MSCQPLTDPFGNETYTTSDIDNQWLLKPKDYKFRRVKISIKLELKISKIEFAMAISERIN